MLRPWHNIGRFKHGNAERWSCRNFNGVKKGRGSSMVEQLFCKQFDVGSSPSPGSMKKMDEIWWKILEKGIVELCCGKKEEKVG